MSQKKTQAEFVADAEATISIVYEKGLHGEAWRQELSADYRGAENSDASHIDNTGKSVWSIAVSRAAGVLTIPVRYCARLISRDMCSGH